MEQDPEVETEDTPMVIDMRCVASNAADAARAIEALNRIMVGLTLDGLDIMVTTSLIEIIECDHDHSETD